MKRRCRSSRTSSGTGSGSSFAVESGTISARIQQKCDFGHFSSRRPNQAEDYRPYDSVFTDQPSPFTRIDPIQFFALNITHVRQFVRILFFCESSDFLRGVRNKQLSP